MPIFAALILALIGGPAFAQAPAADYTVNGWPDGLANVPCDAFKQNPDGSWTQTKTIIVMPSRTRMGGNTFGGMSMESRTLNQRCGGQK